MGDLDQCPRCGLAGAWRGDASGKCVQCYWPDAQMLMPDPRDAEVARLKRALAAGPEALRIFGDREMTARTAIAHVEHAQARAMNNKETVNSGKVGG